MPNIVPVFSCIFLCTIIFSIYMDVDKALLLFQWQYTITYIIFMVSVDVDNLLLLFQWFEVSGLVNPALRFLNVSKILVLMD